MPHGALFVPWLVAHPTSTSKRPEPLGCEGLVRAGRWAGVREVPCPGGDRRQEGALLGPFVAW